MPPAHSIRINPQKPSLFVLTKAASILKKGGVALVPSDTVYGLAASITQPAAVRRVARIKRRKGLPFSLFVAGWKDILWLTKNRPTYVSKLKKLLPGPYTFVLPARSKLPRACIANGKVGLRWPDFGLVSQLVRKTGSPLVATSANRSGEPPLRSGQAACRKFGAEVDLILDGGKLPLRRPSTVVEFRPDGAMVLRRGEGYKKLELYLKKIGVAVRHAD